MRSLVRVLGLVAILFAPAVADAGPPPIDPRQMSGIPRPDPQVPSGTVTVRVLRGSFDKPAIDATVTLEIESPSGATSTKTATTDGQGRVGFTGLEVGARAIAKVDLDGEALATRPIDVLAESGTRVMLVAGAGAASSDSGAKAAPHGPAAPVPGTAFALDGTPKGNLVVGTFDLEARKPFDGVEITLRIETPDGKVEERTGRTDKGGKLVFEGLAAPELPEGTKLSVSGVLEPGAEAQTSESFTMEGDVGLAVVLAKGDLPSAPPPAEASHAGGAPPVAGPRFDPALPQGRVRVHVVDGRNAAVADQTVAVVKRDMSGTNAKFPGVTDARGVVEIDVDIASDAFYFVEARYDGGPYQSGFFQVDKNGGIAVDLRVYPTTSDPRVVRSAVQFDIDGLENDNARVVQFYQVMVSGDKAFWPAEGFQIAPAEGGKSVFLPPFAEDWLTHEDKAAPFATLANPIPPGELANLSIYYIVEHDGSVEIEWTAPFELMESGVLVSASQTLDAPGARPSDKESQVPDKTSYLLGKRRLGEPVKFALGGLPVRDSLYKQIAWIGALLIGLAGAIAVLSRPTGDVRVRLRARRDELLAQLESAPEGEARQLVVAALDRVYRQLEVLERGAKGPTPRAEV
ncbi:MAG TPA: hypothetical protein VFG69_00920 [Nannocystaceae bacterium]|nr:hypothetical protein [Nannocystaceae bacterium]